MIVDSAVYRQGKRIVDDVPAEELGRVRQLATEPGDFVWVGLHEPSEQELSTVEKEFGLHPLAVEDAFTAHQRPKLERYEHTLFLTVKSLWYVDAEDAVETGEINMFVGDDFVITVRHGSGSELHSARRDLEGKSAVLTHGPSAVVYAVCDRVVDGYLSVMSSLEEDVDEVETSVFSPQRTNDSARIYTLKREIAEARRAVLPLREPMRRFATGAVPGIDEESAPFFRDVLDHLNRVAETVDGLDQLLSTAFDAHLAQISVQQNEDMRKISAAAAIVVVPTLIAGVYGMNFQHMPELSWRYGYPYAIALMAASCAVLWLWFKRSGWL
ncbi:MAG TPA: magnesium/cobalt transporter CorA [Nocardioides sp.]|uniref:magnesium/cobalt transporter CorA n=1 Tax=Nocardioides sp. TaxID=35761 RepID=UPI002F40D635